MPRVEPEAKPEPSKLQAQAEGQSEVKVEVHPPGTFPVTFETFKLDMKNLKLPKEVTQQQKT